MAELSGQQVLVTGGAGFVGRAAVGALRGAGASVTVLDRKPFPDRKVPSVVGEITDPAVRDAAEQALSTLEERENDPLDL
jgi:UDP-glucose 4-epimerase